MAQAYALSGSNLIAFDTASPTAGTTTAVTGLFTGDVLAGIDVRPQNGMLYGLGVNAAADTATLYAISVQTGAAGIVGTAGAIALTSGGLPVDLPDPATVGYGFDFNPAVDRIRVTTDSGLNFRVNPNTGALAASDGAINGGTTTISAAAYTNDQPNNGGITTLYTLDSATDTLFIQNPPNNGTQTNGLPVTLGGIPLNFTGIDGFDIPAGVNAPASNAAVASGSGFALLNVGGTTALYGLDLVNGAATLVGNLLGGATPASGLAIRSDTGGVPAVSLSADGATLVRFGTATPGTTTVQALATGSLAAGEQLVGIDFRPLTGQLYGFAVNAAAETATLYLVDPQSGALTAVGSPGGISLTADGVNPADLPASGYGFDFNPTVDRIRVTTDSGLNFRLNPITGAAVDANGGLGGTNPDGGINGLPAGSAGISAAAYTNSFAGATATTLYGLDALSDSLFIQNPPNNGTETNRLPVTLGGSPLDFSSVNGFDIPDVVRVATSNVAATGFGFADLTVGGVTGLYRIDLATGAATSLGTVGAGTSALAGLALGSQVNTPPTITTPGAVSVAENTTVVTALTATDAETGPGSATFSITGGADAALFGISGGNLAFLAPRDFETQAHTYQVQVSASDGAGSVAKLITVTLTDAVPAPPFGTVVTDAGSPIASVIRMYDTALDRNGDTLGLEYFADQIEGGTPLPTLVSGFLNSPEFMSRFGPLNDHDFVDLLYANALDRDSDADPGSQGFRDALAGGTSRASVALAISDSAEHRAIAAGAFSPGTYVANKEGSDVARLYYGVLDRAPDSGGFGFWAGQAESGVSTTAIANGFVASPEFQAAHPGLSNHDFVDLIYDNALGRDSDADPGSLAWINSLDAGRSRGEVAAAISESQEAVARLASVLADGILA